MSTPLITLRADRPPAHVAAFLAAALLLQALFEYLWLFVALPLDARLWGWMLLPALLAPVAVAPFLFRVQAADLRGLLSPLGGVGAWLQAVLYPLLVFGGVVWIYTVLGGRLDPGWRWTTLGMGTAADLPLLALWLLPMTLVQDLVWRQAAAGLGGRNARGVAVLAGAFWTLANGVAVAAAAASGGAGLAIALAALFFGAGCFLARIQERGAFLPSALATAVIATAPALLAGLREPVACRLLFGFDVTDVPALLAPALLPPEAVLGLGGAGLFLASFAVAHRRG